MILLKSYTKSISKGYKKRGINGVKESLSPNKPSIYEVDLN